MSSRYSWMSLLCALGIIISGAANSSMADEVAQAVKDAAKSGLQSYLNAIKGHESEYGFQAGDVSLDLGAPFELYIIHADELASWKPGDDTAKLLTKSTMVFFPVTSSGNYRSILVVDNMAGKWQAVSLGRAPLAKQLGLIRQQWSEAKGYHPRLVAVFQAQKYLFTVPEVSGNNLTPISSSEATDAATAAGPVGVAKYSALEQNVGKVVDDLKSRANLGQ